MACGEEVKAEAANGNGPVDAVYQAINRITEYNVELVKYSLTAKGHGKDALGQVDIVANYNGRRFHGVGPLPILSSHLPAMVHVLNNIWRAAEVEKELQRKSSTQRKQQGNRVMSKNYHIAVLPGTVLVRK
ncbi:alpha-isopropylmalate synthase regulatory domain-containing protein [Escherichia coli]